jgi:hypothetical protein
LIDPEVSPTAGLPELSPPPPPPHPWQMRSADTERINRIINLALAIHLPAEKKESIIVLFSIIGSLRKT